MLKSFEAQGSLSLPWLQANIRVMISTTPMPNDIADWSGYMSFTEHPETDL